MAFSYKTPGAYIEEIVKLPPSVAQVETAIPAFFGVTQKATETVSKDLIGVSKKINSLADYEFYFGFPDVAKASVDIRLNVPSDGKLTADYHNNMYYSVKHYFDNGGGPCFIHSIGDYTRTGVDVNTYKNELQKLDLVDEVTLIVCPDISALPTKDQFYDVYNSAMLKASGLQDKFVIIDVRNEKTNNKVDAGKSKTEFRNTISSNIDSIKYASAYFPNLQTTYAFDFNSANIVMKFAQDVQDANESTKLLNNLDYKIAKQLFAVNAVILFLNDDYFKNISVDLYNAKANEISVKTLNILQSFSVADQQTLITNLNKLTAEVIKQGDAAKLAAQTKFDFADTANFRKTYTDQLKARAQALYTSFGVAVATVDNTTFATLTTTFLTKINPFFNSLFESKLKDAFLAIPLILPPSPAVAGVYGYVDRTRGVWKAPANVSLNAVAKPTAPLSDLDQEDFNVDAENGKSINCIRAFVGRGNLVWGARTLAGNDNEWRYTNVRRFFNMVEESVQNASRQFVFEPNDANTWVRVKGMIDNYLTNLWRAGALQGAKPEHAFYTAVGLNQTMTADDILNGLMIVEIGLAVVRPAEFIILRFSHKLAVS
ncbi:MAG: phage tail sheath C-terminal domain-containing protein [Bacteroidota bacterium]